MLHCACQKPKDLGYSYELWTYALPQSHVRKHCLAASHPSLLELSRSKLHRILTQSEVRPHKIRYYVERRDPEFERKTIEVLHVFKDIEIVNAGLVEGTLKEPSKVTIRRPPDSPVYFTRAGALASIILNSGIMHVHLQSLAA